MKKKIIACLIFLSIISISQAQSVQTMPLSANEKSYRDAMRNGDITAKQKISEKIGEQAGVRWAKQRGMNIILNPLQTTWPFGNDLVAKDHSTGKIYAIELKGGEARAQTFRGYLQGTHGYAVETAKDTLSKNAPPNVKNAAAEILKAARQGKLEAGILSQKHVLGKLNKPPIFKAGVDKAIGKKLAYNFLHKSKSAQFHLNRTNFVKKTTVNQVVSKPSQSHNIVANGLKTTAKNIAKLAPPVLILTEGGFRGVEAYNVEKHYKDGKISNSVRKKLHVENAVSAPCSVTASLLAAPVGFKSGLVISTFTGPAAPFVAPILSIGGAMLTGGAAYIATDVGVRNLIKRFW